MTARGRLLGIFTEIDQAVEAVRQLKASGFRDLTVFTPLPGHEFEEVLGGRTSPVRRLTLIGGILGCASGFALTIYTSLDWPLIVGGKPIVSILPFVIIAFELTILFAGLATLLGVLLFSRLPRSKLAVAYRPGFSEDRFGILVQGGAEELARAEGVLRECGTVGLEHEAA